LVPTNAVGNILRDASQGNVATDAKASLDNALNNSKQPEPPKPEPPKPEPAKPEPPKPILDNALNKARPPAVEPPKPDAPENPIQKPISASKTSWCLVGEYKGRRGCIEIGEQDKCLSGQVYPEQKVCLNPALSQNRPLPTNPPPLDLALKK
jgi:hypothetical protein